MLRRVFPLITQRLAYGLCRVKRPYRLVGVSSQGVLRNRQIHRIRVGSLVAVDKHRFHLNQTFLLIHLSELRRHLYVLTSAVEHHSRGMRMEIVQISRRVQNDVAVRNYHEVAGRRCSGAGVNFVQTVRLAQLVGKDNLTSRLQIERVVCHTRAALKVQTRCTEVAHKDGAVLRFPSRRLTSCRHRCHRLVAANGSARKRYRSVQKRKRRAVAGSVIRNAAAGHRKGTALIDAAAFVTVIRALRANGDDVFHVTEIVFCRCFINAQTVGVPANFTAGKRHCTAGTGKANDAHAGPLIVSGTGVRISRYRPKRPLQGIAGKLAAAHVKRCTVRHRQNCRCIRLQRIAAIFDIQQIIANGAFSHFKRRLSSVNADNGRMLNITVARAIVVVILHAEILDHSAV